ncbi:MAG: hypothetical protein ACTHXA_02005 [Gulosibacter sp.]|uniref:hypothetical protein n=1 Tax=Gulosibacter sp. TaxID=2817531 RepID=UPI003F911FC0
MTLSRTRTWGALLVALLAALFTLPFVAQPAHAAPQVTINGTPSADGATTVQLQGSGFQSVQGGFGGIYVLFGWVDDPSGGSWKPSEGGATGTNYRYVYDDETNPTGYQLFVTFPGSSTASAANGGEVASDGTWSGNLIIPGAVFNTYDRQLNETTVDCNEVVCGIITIGAHGVKNANNESFTPVTFAGGGAATAPSQEAAAPDADAAAPDAAAETDTAEEDTATDPNATQQQTTPVAPVNTSNGEDVGSSLVTLGWLAALLPVLLLVGVSIIVLAAGVGGYLAMKSLLLGVNPEALEKVRGQRERAGIRQREKQKRKTRALERKQELRTARAEDQDAALVARAEMRQNRGVHAAPKQKRNEESVDQWLEFFQSGSKGAAPNDEFADSSGNRGGTPQQGGQADPSSQNNPTVVMTAPRNNDSRSEH